MSSDSLTEDPVLTSDQLREFRESGVLVASNIFSAEEVACAREAFHAQLLRDCGLDVASLADTAACLKALSSTGGAGGILDLFYSAWKLRLNESPRLFAAFSQLWASTWANDELGDEDAEVYKHPFGRFEPRRGYIYIDRVCFRLPDSLATLGQPKKRPLQRSLTPHLDCCPQSLFDSPWKEFPKWRPIQAFVSLTDSVLEDRGGFEACHAHHRRFDEWVANRKPSPGMSSPPCVGDFTPIRPVEDREVLSLMRHVPCRAGDVVFWDYRIPHSNARHNIADSAREVVYLGLLPAVTCNERYAAEQLKRYRAGDVPVDQWHECVAKQPCDYEFSELGRKLMAIDPFEPI